MRLRTPQTLARAYVSTTWGKDKAGRDVQFCIASDDEFFFQNLEQVGAIFGGR